MGAKDLVQATGASVAEDVTVTHKRTRGEHTPGPWEVCPGVYDTNPETATEFPHGPEVVAGDDTIAWCSLYGEANARLIAAAPDMLAALRHAVDAIEYGCPEFEALGEGGKLTLAIVNAAIAKAEGRQS